MIRGRFPARGRLPHLLGIALIAAAAWTLTRHNATLASAWETLRKPSPVWLVFLIGAVALHFLLTASVLRTLLNRVIRVGSIGMRETLALAVMSALGNMVPMQAGLAGRIAYQHRVHGVPVTASVLIVVQATLLTLGAGVWIGLALLIVHSGGLSWAAVPASLVLVVPAALDANRPRSILCRVFLLRCMEVLVAGVRVHASLALTGCEADPLASLALGTAANLCNAIPVVGSAIGVREWCTALLAPTILGIGTPEVLMAQLLDRAAEIVLVLVGSAAAMPSLSRRLASTPTPLARVPFFETTPASTDTTPVDQRGAVVESLPKAEPPPSS